MLVFQTFPVFYFPAPAKSPRHWKLCVRFIQEVFWGQYLVGNEDGRNGQGEKLSCDAITPKTQRISLSMDGLLELSSRKGRGLGLCATICTNH